MKAPDPAVFHKLYGVRKPRIAYFKRDFIDYVLMIGLSGLVITLCYGGKHLMGAAGLVLCVVALVMFGIRHGVELAVPVLFRRPQEVLYMVTYKLQNLRDVYFIALGVLLLENALIVLTPNLPHHVEFTRQWALYLFYFHFVSIAIYRTAILIAHLAKRSLVREVLMQSTWRRAVRGSNVTLEIVHAYCTGILTHIILIAPWYFVITHANFSVIFLPIVCAVNVATQFRFYSRFGAWFYRDHWLGHNSEFEFIFLHGTHHDAIPSGLIAVGENGFLEGFMRFTIGGFPTAFYNPLIAFLFLTLAIKGNIDLHQYIPGIFPRLARSILATNQHATHHYGSLEPYSLGTKPEYFKLSDVASIRITRKFLRFIRVRPSEGNAIKLDEDLTGFKWDNINYRKILSIYDKYHH
jgi:hypothetical protein